MDLLGPQDARQDYFLDTQDLKRIPHESLGGGIGCGPPFKLYEPNDLEQAAIQKWGVDGLKKKRAARAKRMENKRKKEEAAEQALEALEQQQQQQNNDENANPEAASATKRAKTTASASSSSKPKASNDATIRKLRTSLLRLAKRNLRFTRAGGPDKWRIEVPATLAENFAALMGRPQDTSLKSFCKKGAYYSEDTNAQDFFQCPDEDELTRFFSRQGVGIQIGEEITVKYKPSTMDLSVSGYGEITPY